MKDLQMRIKQTRLKIETLEKIKFFISELQANDYTFFEERRLAGLIRSLEMDLAGYLHQGDKRVE